MLSPLTFRLLLGAGLFILGVVVHKHFSDAKIAQIRAEHVVEIEKLNRQAREAETNMTNQILNERQRYEDEKVVADGRVNDLLVRLRNERARASLQPAARAPAECAKFEAPPSRLSEPDREFLVGLAAEADQVARERNLCFAEYEIVRENINRFADQAAKNSNE